VAPVGGAYSNLTDRRLIQDKTGGVGRELFRKGFSGQFRNAGFEKVVFNDGQVNIRKVAGFSVGIKACCLYFECPGRENG